MGANLVVKEKIFELFSLNAHKVSSCGDCRERCWVFGVMSRGRSGGRSAGSELLRSTQADMAGAGGEEDFGREGLSRLTVTRPEAPKLLDVGSCYAILQQHRLLKKVRGSAQYRNRKREREVEVERYGDRVRQGASKSTEDFFGGLRGNQRKHYYPTELLRRAKQPRHQRDDEEEEDGSDDDDGEGGEEEEEEENEAVGNESDHDDDYGVNHYADDDDFGDDDGGGGFVVD